MKDTLNILFDKSIQLGEANYTEKQVELKWIGNPPVSSIEIEEAESRLGIIFPQDYIELLTIANGFPTCSNSVEPSFLKVSEIDFYKNYHWNVIDDWSETGELDDIVSELKRAIMIAGHGEEQQFLIIPPTASNNKWKYWKFATWIPGEEVHADLHSYLVSVIDFLNDVIKE